MTACKVATTHARLDGVLVLVLLVLLPALGDVQAKSDSQTIDISGSANDLIVNYDYPDFATVGQTFDVGLNAFASTTGLTVAINGGAAWTYTGCSFVSETTAGTLTGIKSARVRISMDTNTCSATAIVTVTLTVGGSLESQAYISMNVFQQSTAISSWPTLNVIQKTCASGDTLPSCTTPITGNVNFNCGATGTTVAGLGSSTCLIPQVDNENRICNFSSFGAACIQPVLTVHQDALSGTVNVVNSGGEAITLTGVLSVHQDPLSGAVTVTNNFGQALTVHQDPTTGSLVLSGTVLECSSAALANDPKACTENSNSNTTLNVGTVNSNSTMKSSFSLDVPILTTWVPLLFWFGLFAFVYFRIHASGPKYVFMGLIITIALFTQMIPSMALLSTYAGIGAVVLAAWIIVVSNRFGFEKPETSNQTNA